MMRYRGIDMNEVRQLYLGTYSRIDSIDHFIKNCSMKYRCWKYWNSPNIHAMYLAVVVAYDIYIKMEEGELDQTWKGENIVDLWKFCYLLSNQMLNHNPTHQKYASDTNMRPSTQQNQAARDHNKDDARGKIESTLEEDIQLSNFSKKIKESKYR